jgi:hypothetical protein
MHPSRNASEPGQHRTPVLPSDMLEASVRIASDRAYGYAAIDGFIRTGTRESSSRPGVRFSTKRPDTSTQTVASLNFKPLCGLAADHTFTPNYRREVPWSPPICTCEASLFQSVQIADVRPMVKKA